MDTVSCSTEGMAQLRCCNCGKLLAYGAGRVAIKCGRCKTVNVARVGPVGVSKEGSGVARSGEGK